MKVITYLIGCILVISLVGFGMIVLSTTNTSKPSHSVTWTPSLSSPTPSTELSNSTLVVLPADSMISASQLDAVIKAQKDWQIVDVREANEYATGHVTKAVNIPLGSLKTHQTELYKDKDIILVCLNGTRSFTAWKTLTQEGYDPNRLKVLIGGMEQWKRLGSEEITESIGGC